MQNAFLGFPCGSAGKDPPVMWEAWVPSLGWEDPLEQASILAWRIPWTTVLGGSKSWTSLSDFTFTFIYIEALVDIHILHKLAISK